MLSEEKEYIRVYYINITLNSCMKELTTLVYYLKTGMIISHEELNALIAKEYGITPEVASLASIRCCFNHKKKDIMRDLVQDKTELERAGIDIDNHDINDIHDFFHSNKDIPFFSYCDDYLTSWDIVSNIYKNDYPPSLLAQAVLQEEVDITALNASVGKAESMNIEKKLNKTTILRRVINGHTVKEVREFLEENNYDFNLAQKKFNWNRKSKYKYKQCILRKGDNYIRLVGKYPLLTGIPIIVKLVGKEAYLKFIDLDIVTGINDTGRKDFDKLVKRVLKIQSESILQYNNNRLNKTSITLMNSSLNETMDMLLYLSITEKEDTIDYANNWKINKKAEINNKLKKMLKIEEDARFYLLNTIIPTMLFSNNVEKNLYKEKGWMDLLIDNNDNISITQLN